MSFFLLSHLFKSIHTQRLYRRCIWGNWWYLRDLQGSLRRCRSSKYL